MYRPLYAITNKKMMPLDTTHVGDKNYAMCTHLESIFACVNYYYYCGRLQHLYGGVKYDNLLLTGMINSY